MLRILVVEDDPAIRDLLAELLAMFAYRTDTAENGAVGLERMAEAVPDAVLLDMMMPVMDGPAFIAACQRNPAWAAVPIILMTAAVDFAISRDLPVQAIVRKPFDADDVLGVVRRLTDRGARNPAPNLS